LASNRRFARLRPLPRPARGELQELLLLALLSPFIVAPPPLERLAARAVVARQFRTGGWVRNERLRKLPPDLPGLTGTSALQLAKKSEEESIRERTRVLRAIVFPWWKRRLTVGGLSNVRAGLAAGNGVILWVHHCAESNVAVKQAMWSAGFPLAHLSRPGHPFSTRPFSVAMLNPLLRRPEVRFLAERVPIDAGNTIAPLRRLQRLLSENRAVSITVSRTADQLEMFPFLGGTVMLPTGPARLAARSGAPLLPVFTWAGDGRTHVEIGPPLPVTGTRPEQIRPALAEAAHRLELRVVEHPEAWTGWRSQLFSVEPPAATG
jgi:lauroyl/myristoyl acyltransferase